MTLQRLGGRGPQHHRLPLRMYSMKDFGKLVIRHRRAEAYNHLLTSEVRELVGREVWDSYFKFRLNGILERRSFFFLANVHFATRPRSLNSCGWRP